MKVASVSTSLFTRLRICYVCLQILIPCVSRRMMYFVLLQKSRITAVTPCKKVAGIILEIVATNETLLHIKVKRQTDDMLADLEAADLSLDKHV